MHIIIIILLLLVIISIVYTFVNVIDINNENIQYPLVIFDNENVPLIEPPSEITIEGNSHECHKSLTPCITHGDCDLCREGLANCQYFDEDTIIQLHTSNDEEYQVLIKAGESYCLALDRERARSCNPNTGVWLLAETPIGFSLLCSCLRPGLVTQLNMYEDCNIPVGCAPHGYIENINSNPTRCVCDDGYISDYNNTTETPFCRPKTVRDVMYDESFFNRWPCANGQIRLDHPAINDFYRSHFRLGDICVIDPCSVDPISGRRTQGRIFHHINNNNVEINGCHCGAMYGLIPIYNRHTARTGMIKQSDIIVANACLQPFNVHLLSLPHVDYKYFWARSDHDDIADADLIFQVSENQLSHERYRAILYPILNPHPDVTEITSPNVRVMKISMSYDANVPSSTELVPSIFRSFKRKEQRINEPCFFPGIGRCSVARSNECIDRNARAQVWTAEVFTNSWCFLSREGANIRIWSNASRYRRGDAPIALRLKGFFLNDDRERNTIRAVTVRDVTSDEEIDALTQVVATFPNYSV